MDFPYLSRYKSENAALSSPQANENRIVFLGDSITEFWSNEYPEFFNNKAFINRGISGQTTPQMRLRFQQDVIELQPKMVHILAGTNDIAGNTGESTLEMIAENLAAMAQMADAHEINVVFGAILPACHYSWSPKIKPAPLIVQLNTWISDFAANKNYGFIHYHQQLSDDKNCMQPQFADDGVHPNALGYEKMSHHFNLYLHATIQ